MSNRSMYKIAMGEDYAPQNPDSWKPTRVHVQTLKRAHIMMCGKRITPRMKIATGADKPNCKGCVKAMQRSGLIKD